MKSSYNSKPEGELIRKLKSLEVNPPSGLWDEIDSTLKARSRKRIIAITAWASAAAIAMLLSIGGFMVLQEKTDTAALTSNNTTNQNKSEIIKNLSVKIDSEKPIETNKSRALKSIEEISTPKTTEASNKHSEKPATPKDSIYVAIKVIEPIKIAEKRTAHEELKFSPETKISNADLLAFTEPNEVKHKGNWYISASGFPVYSYHSAGLAKKDGTERQAGISSFGGAISVRYEFANQVSIESGLSLGFMGQKEKNLYLVNSGLGNYEVSSNSGFTNNYGTFVVSNPNYKVMDIVIVNRLSYDAVNESNFQKIDAYQKFRYLEIPLMISKGYDIKNFKIFFKGGITAGILVHNLLDLKGESTHLQGKTNGVDKFISTAVASFGVSLPISSRANLVVEPSLKLGLKPVGNSNSKSYPFSSYIKFGVEVPI